MKSEQLYLYQIFKVNIIFVNLMSCQIQGVYIVLVQLE